MNKTLLILLFLTLFPFQITAQEFLTTPFEYSQGKKSATYDEGILYFNQLADRNSSVNSFIMGKTDSGLPLHLVIFDSQGFQGFDHLKNSGKIRILIMNAIHPGEPDGVDASMMLMRDLLQNRILKEIQHDFILMIIPFYNVGGALNRGSNSRANQLGPEEYGFRGNSKNLDLNRDFIKMDSKNARSFAQFFRLIDPDILVDTHVTNGADYSYSLTYIETQPDLLGGKLGPFVREKFSPAIEGSMTAENRKIIPYVNVFGQSPDKGYQQFIDYPRYSTGYAALFQTIGYVCETHMLKPFKERVDYTYFFLKSIIEQSVHFKDSIKLLRASDRRYFTGIKHYPIRWELDSTRITKLAFKGYEAKTEVSRVTGNPVTKYDRSQPYNKNIPYYNYYQAIDSVSIPDAYIIPQAWEKAIKWLRINHIRMIPFEKDTTLMVEQCMIKAYDSFNYPYEGHYRHFNTQVSGTPVTLRFRQGDLLIPCRQESIRYILECLEPEAPDSFFNWNFFDTILQQKEHFSTYVFDDLAEKILEENPHLKDSLEYMKNLNPEFRENNRSQLNYIYKNSVYYEKEHMRYPIYRLNFSGSFSEK